MNDNTEKLIRELADKLGTTAERLWDVLCKQALISGVTNLTVIAVWTACLVWAWIALRKHTETGSDERCYSLLAFWTLVAITGLIVGCSLEHIAGSLLNPEYWALKQIIK